jgi:hypothetical protein
MFLEPFLKRDYIRDFEEFKVFKMYSVSDCKIVELSKVHKKGILQFWKTTVISL